LIKKTVSKDERARFLSLKERRAKTVSERIFHAGENPRVFVSTDLILSCRASIHKKMGELLLNLSLQYLPKRFKILHIGEKS